MIDRECNYGIEEEESIIGTPLGRFIYARYNRAINEALDLAAPQRTVLDAGCAGGDTLQAMRPGRDLFFAALDISPKMIESSLSRNPEVEHILGSLYELPFADASYDTVVCTQVLEHLDNPKAALDEIRRVAARSAVISIPNEPLFRLANLVRLRHVRRFGSTPGHIQHLTRSGFRKLLEPFFSSVKIRSILGVWNVAVCHK